MCGGLFATIVYSSEARPRPCVCVGLWSWRARLSSWCMAGSEECSGYIGAICCRRRRKRSNSACSRSRSCPAARERHRDHTHTYRYAREHRRARSRGRGFDAVVREGRGEGTRGREQASRLDRQGGSGGGGRALRASLRQGRACGGLHVDRMDSSILFIILLRLCSLRCGHRRMPCSRQIFLRTVVHTPRIPGGPNAPARAAHTQVQAPR